jgi:hypothetical protein
MLLRRLAASTSAGAVGSVTQSSALTGSASASQSSTLGPPSSPPPGTCLSYLDSGASFHMIPHSTHLAIWLFRLPMARLFLLLGGIMRTFS